MFLKHTNKSPTVAAPPFLEKVLNSGIVCREDKSWVPFECNPCFGSVLSETVINRFIRQMTKVKSSFKLLCCFFFYSGTSRIRYTVAPSQRWVLQPNILVNFPRKFFSCPSGTEAKQKQYIVFRLYFKAMKEDNDKYYGNLKCIFFVKDKKKKTTKQTH